MQLHRKSDTESSKTRKLIELCTMPGAHRSGGVCKDTVIKPTQDIKSLLTHQTIQLVSEGFL